MKALRGRVEEKAPAVLKWTKGKVRDEELKDKAGAPYPHPKYLFL